MENKFFSNEEFEALLKALKKAAENYEQDVYEFMENTPKTSFVVELGQALHEVGYKIVKI